MMKVLTNILEWWRDFFDSVGRARAASELARHGHYRAAQRLMKGESII